MTRWRKSFLIIAILGAGLFEISRLAASTLSKPDTRAVHTLSQKTYDGILHAQTLSSAGKHQLALTHLEELLKNQVINPYEQAMIFQQQAFLWAEQGDFSMAIRLLKKTIAMKTLPLPAEHEARFHLAQIYIAADQVEEAITLLTHWIEQTDNVPPVAYILLSQAWASLGDIEQATPYAERAVKASDPPREDWLYLLISLYLRRDFYDKALLVAEQGATLYPDRPIFWRQLTSLYARLKQPEKSFAALESLYQLGLLTQSWEYRQLAQYYLAYQTPLEAAHLLEKGLRQNQIEKNHQIYQLLGDAWAMAREWKKAITALTRAAPLVDHGRIWQRLGSSYLQDKQWEKAEWAFEKALEKGELSNEGKAWLLLGIARARQKKQEPAFAALGQAILFDETSSQAKIWMDNLRADRLIQADSADD